MQCLVDEPQFPNSLSYRALSGIARSRMPGVKIHDPVETTEIGGAIDVWAVKQAVYEKYIDTYRALQDIGEEIWLYTCGFPAGKTMNRILDLPLTVSRLPMYSSPSKSQTWAHSPQRMQASRSMRWSSSERRWASFGQTARQAPHFSHLWG